MNILISGVWASNKGDRAIATYLVNKLLHNPKIDKIYVSANDPDLLRQYLPSDVKVVNMGYMFKNKFTRGYSKIIGFSRLIDGVNKDNNINISLLANRDYVLALKDSDLVILTGGHHITTMREKDSIYSMTYELGLINRSKKKYILWSQTIGPLVFEKRANEEYISNLLAAAQRIYVRDDNSDIVLRSQFASLTNVFHSYDSVFGIKTSMKEELDGISKDNVVGVSIFYSNYKTSTEIDNYANMMAGICRKIIQCGFAIRFFPMETSEKEIQIINKIIRISGVEMNSEIINTNVSTVNQLKAMNKCRFYIGHKTHSVIISLMLGIPLIALCYHEKTYDFMKLFDMQEFAIIDKHFNQKWFEEKFELLISKESEIKDDINGRGIEISEMVNNDFDEALLNE